MIHATFSAYEPISITKERLDVYLNCGVKHKIWWHHSSYERYLRNREVKAWKIQYTGINSFSCLCGPQRIVEQKVSTNCRMAALPDCFPSSSRLLLREYWNFVPNNTNVHVMEIKIFTAVQDLVLIFRPTMHCVPNKGNSWCLFSRITNLMILLKKLTWWLSHSQRD